MNETIGDVHREVKEMFLDCPIEIYDTLMSLPGEAHLNRTTLVYVNRRLAISGTGLANVMEHLRSNPEIVIKNVRG